MTIYPYFDIKGPAGEKFQFEVKAEHVTIGRFEQWNDIALNPDPQQLISRKAHCVVKYENGWWVMDNGSVNRTFLRRMPNEPVEVVQGRAQIREGEVICILGQLLEEGDQVFWELTFHDPAVTNPAEHREISPTNVFLEYDWTQAQLYRTEHRYRQELPQLRPQEHKLVRYMAQRNRANDGEPVLCSVEELITAVWGDAGAVPDADLAHLVWQLRRKIERDYKQPRLLENVRGLGYRLQLRPLE